MRQGHKNIPKLLAMAFVMFFANAFAQEDARLIYEGNTKYYDSNYVYATAAYREALKKNPKNYKASFNLGNAMYRNAGEIKNTKVGILQGKQKVSPDSLANLVYEEAAQSFAIVANTVSDKDTLHRAWHNIGNCYLMKKDWDQAITAYKKALKFDPKDEATRYNLAYALKNRPPKQNKGGGGNQNQQQQQQQQQQQKISKEDAERLLKALMNAEKKTQDRRKQKQEDASKSNPDKDW
jgi:Ca-activated chloride channel family protein